MDLEQEVRGMVGVERVTVGEDFPVLLSLCFGLQFDLVVLDT